MTPKGPRIHGFKMKNSTNHIAKNIIQMGPNFLSLEAVESSACVGHKTNKFEQKKIHIESTQNCLEKKHEAQFGLLSHLGVKSAHLCERL